MFRKILLLFFLLFTTLCFADPVEIFKPGQSYYDLRYLKLNQTTPQDIINGQPDFLAGLRAGSTNQLSIDASGNVLTSGTLGAGAITGTSLTDGTATLTAGELTEVTNLIMKTPALGAEKIYLGTFTGSIDARWTYDDACWSYGTNNVVKDADGVGTLSQTSANMVTPVVAGEFYTLYYYITSWTVGSVTPSVGGVTLETAGANGVYWETFQAVSAADLVFTPTSTSRFTIDTISLKKTDGRIYGGALWLDGVAGGVPTSGAGTRLMWIPTKGAFRAGNVTSIQWNTINIGSYSVATGYNTTASGQYSTALGYNTKATGTSSTAIGEGVEASGIGSFATGYKSSGTMNASGSGSKAQGYFGGTILASGGGSSCAGYGFSGSMTASGAGSSIQGYTNGVGGGYGRFEASGNGSSAMGYAFGGGSGVNSYITASGDGSIAMGYMYRSGGGTGYLRALGHGSIAMGYATSNLQAGEATTDYGAIALGYNVQALGVANVAIGQSVTTNTGNNVIGIGKSFTNSTDSSFGIGFGGLDYLFTATSLLVDTTNKIEFGDTGTYINQATDGHLDLTADVSIDLNGLTESQNIVPATDDTYYLGEVGTPFKAYKGVILKDQAGTGKHYRLEVSGDALRIVALD